MIQHTTSTSIIPNAAKPLPRRAFSRAVVSSAARNLSYGLSEGFSQEGVDFAEGVVGFAAAGFPTIKYLRIFSSCFGPSPRIASKSSTLLKDTICAFARSCQPSPAQFPAPVAVLPMSPY